MLFGMILVFSLAGCASTPQSAARETPERVISVGQSTQEDVRAAVGDPSERITDQDEEVWIYSEDRIKVPMLISFIPVVGDIADVAETVSDMKTRYELIVIFDALGIVKSFRRREAQ